MAKSILFVANVTKEHILKFHLPTIKVFKENGWNVDVISSGDEPVPYCDKQISAKWKRSPFNFSLFKGIAQLKKILRNTHYDIIYCHTPVGGLVGRLASSKARKNGTKVIYCAHGFHFYKGSSLVNWIVFYTIEKILARKSDAIFLVNKEDYKLSLNKFKKCKDIRLVPEVGVNFDRLNIKDAGQIRADYRKKYNILDDEIVLIYVAELIKNKNQKMLIDCLHELRKRNIKAKLVLVGPNHYGDKLLKYANKKKISQFVLFLGWRNDVGELLNMSDICLASSIREGFGLNIVEAMYCGLPVIATNNRGHSTIVEDRKNGYLVDINDYSGMADIVLELLDNGTCYIKPTREQLLRYDSLSVARTLYDEIKGICDGKV